MPEMLVEFECPNCNEIGSMKMNGRLEKPTEITIYTTCCNKSVVLEGNEALEVKMRIVIEYHLSSGKTLVELLEMLEGPEFTEK